MTEDEMVGWHHRPKGYEFEQAPGVSDGQGSLVCCNSWGCKQSDTTERLNSTELNCCESWSIKKAEHRRIDAFELSCWRRLLRVL